MAISRKITSSARASASGRAAKRKRSANGKLITHWRNGNAGSTSSASSAAVSTEMHLSA